MNMDESGKKATRGAREDLRSVDADGKIPDYEKMGFVARAKQMQLASWQPEFATPWVVSALVLTTAVFIPLGALIIIASDRSQEVRQRYDNVATQPDKPQGETCDWQRRVQLAGVPNPAPMQIPSHCNVRFEFTVSDTMDPPVFMYYELTGFYQNFRKLVNSRSDKQLAAQTDECDCRDAPACLPQEYPGYEKDNDNWQIQYFDIDGTNNTKSISSIPYGPCGQMPFVMFNDSVILSVKGQGQNQNRVLCNTKLFDKRGNRNETTAPFHENPCNKSGIAWSGDTDSDGRYQPFPTPTQALTGKGLCAGECNATRLLDGNGDELETAILPDAILDGMNRGHYWREWGHKIPETDDLDFIVWSRPATLPTFKKLFRIIQLPLVPGETYILDIEDRFPVGSFSGEKAIVFATRTWIGGDNSVLGGAYCCIGSLACAWSLLFVILHLKNPLGGYTPENLRELEKDAFSGGLGGGK